MTIGGYRLWPLLRSTGREIIDDNIPGLAAQLAYYFIFSLFPVLLVIVPLVGLIADRQQLVSWLMGKLAEALPSDALHLVTRTVSQTVFAPSAPGLISVGAILALWSGSALFSGLMGTLNTAYGVRETRPFWKQRLIAIASVLVTGLLIGIASIVTLVGPQIAKWIDNHTPVGHAFATIWNVVQWPIAFAILVAALFLVYYFLPNLRQNVRQVLVGAVTAAVLWIVVTLLFRLYVQNFGSYNKTYGAIGGVIILLTWMYLTMLATLAAGELSAELHNGTGATSPRNGVTYAGRIVTALDAAEPSTSRVQSARSLAPRRP